MGTTLAAMKGKLGNTDYFIIAMKAKELVEKAVIPSEMEEWHNLTLEEKEQRDINYNRVKKEIAPYLAKDKGRFFGAIIVAAKHFDPGNFEPIADVATKGLPKLYQTQARLLGFLTLTGGEVLIPLDGQHRLKAIQFALNGKDEHDRPIPGMSPCTDLANEDITVMLVPYDRQKSRKIFTRVNRYARPTSSGQNLVTDDEDYIAISARMVANKIIGSDLVKTRGTSLSEKDGEFSALSSIADCNKAILEAHFSAKVGKPFIINAPETRKMYDEKISDIWRHLTENIETFRLMLSDPTEDGDEKRREIRRDYLLGKPIPQWCLVRAFSRLMESNAFTPKEASDRLNKIDWRQNAELWDLVLVAGKRLLYKNKKLAADLIYYVAGGKMDDDERIALLQSYQLCFPTGNRPKELPPKV